MSSEYHCTGFTAVIHADKIKSLEALSTSAVPIAFWTREQVQLPADSSDLLHLFFEKRLNIGTMSNINELMRVVLRLRQRSDSGEVRKHISLFWDDPGRYIPYSEAQSP